MPSETSRRNLLKTGMAAAAAAASGVLPAVAQQSTAKPESFPEIEAQLAKPLSETAKGLLPAAVKASRGYGADRLKFNLPENSEPCTIYTAIGVDK